MEIILYIYNSFLLIYSSILFNAFDLVLIKFGTIRATNINIAIIIIPVFPARFDVFPIIIPRTPKSKSPKVVF